MPVSYKVGMFDIYTLIKLPDTKQINITTKHYIVETSNDVMIWHSSTHYYFNRRIVQDG